MEKNLSTTPKFVKGIWITGNLDLNNEFLIGRTCIRRGRNVVSTVTMSGALIEVPFENIQNIKRLNILKTPPPITSSFSRKTQISMSEKMVIEVLNSINCN